MNILVNYDSCQFEAFITMSQSYAEISNVAGKNNTFGRLSIFIFLFFFSLFSIDLERHDSRNFSDS